LRKIEIVFLEKSKVKVLLFIVFLHEIYCYKYYVFITPFRKTDKKFSPSK
jgi:hypothetical protein